MSRGDVRTTERLHAAQLRGVTVEVGPILDSGFNNPLPQPINRVIQQLCSVAAGRHN